MIVKSGRYYVVKSKSSGRVLGRYTSRAAAQKRLAQVEFFKNKKSGRRTAR